MASSKNSKYDQKSNSISIRSINIHTPSGATGPIGNYSHTKPNTFVGGGGGGGVSYISQNAIYTTSASGTISTGWGQAANTVFNSDVIIRREGQPDIAIGQTLDSIAKRLAILSPDFDKMSKFPALKEAYDNYNMIEALVTGMDDDEQLS